MQNLGFCPRGREISSEKMGIKADKCCQIHIETCWLKSNRDRVYDKIHLYFLNKIIRKNFCGELKEGI